MNVAESKFNLTDYPLLSGILITAIFSVVLSLNVIFRIQISLINAGFSAFFVYFADFSVRFLSGTFLVILMVLLLKFLSQKDLSINNYLRTDVWLSKGVSTKETVVVGIFSPLCYFII